MVGKFIIYTKRLQTGIVDTHTPMLRRQGNDRITLNLSRKERQERKGGIYALNYGSVRSRLFLSRLENKEPPQNSQTTTPRPQGH